MVLPKPELSLLAALLALPLVAGTTGQASADDYVGYRRIGSWNLAKKSNQAGKRIEMMAVASRETEADFFLIMCDSTGPSLYVSIVTREPSLTAEEPLQLEVGYAFDEKASHLKMSKVLIDDQAVLRDPVKADVEGLVSEMAKSQSMQITAGKLTRSYDLTSFAQAFDVVDTACRQSAAP